MVRTRLLCIVFIVTTIFVFVGHPAADTPVTPAPSKGAGQEVPETRSAQVGDIKIGYRVVGEGHPLLFITGYGATMDMWDPALLNALASRYKVILFDNRGMGATTASDKPFSIGLFAEDTVGLMDTLKIGKAHVLGWSMGTFIALELALRHPERVSKLILYAGNCGWKGKGVVPARPEVSAALMDLSGTPRERGARLVSILFPEKWLKEHPDFLAALPRSREEPSLAVVERQGQAIDAWPGMCDSLDRVSQPTLVITGTEDLVIPPANSLMLASRIPGSWLIRLPGGHSNMYQYPRAFSRSILAFLESPAN